MKGTGWGARVLVVFGLAALLIGTVDPLEGSVLILLGIAVFTLEAWLTSARRRRAITWALLLTAVGVVALFAVSALGGVGGGRSWWWLLVLLPYPAGWLLGLVTGIRQVRDAFRPAAGIAR